MIGFRLAGWLEHGGRELWSAAVPLIGVAPPPGLIAPIKRRQNRAGGCRSSGHERSDKKSVSGAAVLPCSGFAELQALRVSGSKEDRCEGGPLRTALATELQAAPGREGSQRTP
ncbi:hypothetical protein NDU88_004960 [Pleurodeles waltl]|uniref:Uncharacterized protein n=1 Tax=Pleurodeles waltl TaxID=8319 RepID=A0AAV7WXB5_PLEWA|nr:hypothetical protein NDU88_004960 [Pleurodeles waltl]